MSHFLQIVLIPLLYLFYTLQVSYLLGFFLLRLIKIDSKFDFIFQLGASLLLGYGLLGYLSLLLSLAGPLNKIVILLIYFFIFLLGRNYLIVLYGQIYRWIRSFKEFDIFSKIIFIIILLFIVFYSFSAFAPPYQSDAVAYHLPEAINIANHGISFPLEGGRFFGTRFFGNLPALMETLYAFVYTLSGFVLVHLSHFSIVLAFLLIIYSVIKHEFGSPAGLLSVFSIFFFYDFFVGAGSAFIDSAVSSFEITAIILILLWSKYESRSNLILAGILYGLALSSKYLPLYSLVVIGPFIIFQFWQKKKKLPEIIKDALSFGMPILLFSGFWYMKNFIMLGNPVYPFVFNHDGFTEQEFKFLSGDLKHTMINRTFANFIFLPLKLFLEPLYLPILPFFFLFPIGLFFKKNAVFLRYLMFFVFLYITIWFFIISHIKRYGMVGFVLLLIVGGIIISDLLYRVDFLIKKKRTKISLSMLLILVVVFCGVWVLKSGKIDYISKTKKWELEYMLGQISKEEFYEKNGFAFELSQFINSNLPNTKVLNHWNGLSFFLRSGTEYVSILYEEIVQKENLHWSEVCIYLRSRGIQYIVVDESLKKTNNNKYWSENVDGGYYAKKLDFFENIVLEHSTLVFSRNERNLYQIDPQCDLKQ
jgi:hypothetical protein